MFRRIVVFALAAAALRPVLILLVGATGTWPAYDLSETPAIEPTIDLDSSLGPSEEFKLRKLEPGVRTVVSTEGPYEIALRGG
jgi:hypothetical protein